MGTVAIKPKPRKLSGRTLTVIRSAQSKATAKFSSGGRRKNLKPVTLAKINGV